VLGLYQFIGTSTTNETVGPLNIGVLFPWSNYLVFGTNALLVWLFSRNRQRSTPQGFALFVIGALLFLSALIRTQAILLYPGFLAVLFLYSRGNWLSKAAALSFGLFVPLLLFVLKLAHDGTLTDYYLQTVMRTVLISPPQCQSRMRIVNSSAMIKASKIGICFHPNE
jgi:hypothetical protein